MLNLANSINRLNLLVQQTKLQEQLQGQEVPKAKIVAGSPQTVFIGDLPKELSLVELYDFLKEKVGDCEVVLKRQSIPLFLNFFIDQLSSTSTMLFVASQTSSRQEGLSTTSSSQNSMAKFVELYLTTKTSSETVKLSATFLSKVSGFTGHTKTSTKLLSLLAKF